MNESTKLYEYLGSEYRVIRTRITLKGFKELLVRQIKPIELQHLIYLVDYRK